MRWIVEEFLKKENDFPIIEPILKENDEENYYYRILESAKRKKSVEREEMDRHRLRAFLIIER